MEELKSVVATLQEKIKVCEHRILNLEKNLKDNNAVVQRLEITMNNLSNKLDNTSKVADKLLSKLERIEEEPKKVNDTVKACIITLIVTTIFNQVVTFLFSK